jgi:hypothetical protein
MCIATTTMQYPDKHLQHTSKIDETFQIDAYYIATKTYVASK